MQRRRLSALAETTPPLLAAGAFAAITAGGALHLLDRPSAGDAVWAGATAAMLLPLSVSVVRALRRRDLGVDVIALLAIGAALALGEYLAGAVVALMLSGGNALEAFAARRARRELTALVERAPRVAHVHRADALVELPVDAVAVGDVVLVRAGEVVPVDGIVLNAEAVLDESTLTGEPLPATRAAGSTVRSGSVNAGSPFDIRASRPAAESAYAALVRLVAAAETERAPFVRLADRYAAVFLPLTLVAAALGWGLSDDPVRALAVLVVATPCPLILAAPVAIIAGISRAASAGIVVKGGTAIEKLGEARTVLLDKTGTLTLGTPEVERVVTAGGESGDEVLRLAASLDQVSVHVLAEALVHGAQRRGLELSFPADIVEKPGEGIEGTVGGRRVAVGSSSWLAERGYDGQAVVSLSDGAEQPGRARIFVGAAGRPLGAILMSDHLREDAHGLVDALRMAGISHVAMVTGDDTATAEEVGRQAGVDRVYSELTPEGKVEVVEALRARAELRPVVMVGDGVNDAPALALADVGIAMGSAGATVSSETADAVIVVDRIDAVADGVRIGRRSLGIARQSVVVGIGLSVIAMGFAAAGYISPVAGALLQEGIDVAVIANALRALRG